MRIRRLSLAEGAAAAEGTAVIIDVFRAFTCAPLMLHCGAKRILLEGDPAAALAYRAEVDATAILIGEINEAPIEGFDLTNSPWLILQRGRALFAGRTVVHRTTSGVTGAITALAGSDTVLLASYLTAAATAAWIRSQRPAVVSIVAMGIRSHTPAPEDEACGDYIESLLGGRPYDHTAALARILGDETAQKFLRGDKPYLPREDVPICLQRDLFDVVLRAERCDGRIQVTPLAGAG